MDLLSRALPCLACMRDQSCAQLKVYLPLPCMPPSRRCQGPAQAHGWVRRVNNSKGEADLDGHAQPLAVAVDVEQLELDAAGGSAVDPPVPDVYPAAIPRCNLHQRRTAIRLLTWPDVLPGL